MWPFNLDYYKQLAVTGAKDLNEIKITINKLQDTVKTLQLTVDQLFSQLHIIKASLAPKD